MLVAVAVFAVMDLSMKRLAETYPAMQVTFIRGLASLPFLLLATGTMGHWRDLRPNRCGPSATRLFAASCRPRSRRAEDRAGMRAPPLA